MAKRGRWALLAVLIIFSLLVFWTRSWWQQPFFDYVTERKVKFENLKLVLDLLIALPGIVTAYISFLLLFKTEKEKEPGRESILKRSNPELLLCWCGSKKNLTTWIDRKIVSASVLRREPRLVLVGRMKSGKSREAVELVRQAIDEGMVLETQVYDITDSTRELLPGTIQPMLAKFLDHSGRALFFFNEIPASPTDKQLEALGEYLKALRHCSAGYFISTLRAEHLENSPGLQKWLDDQQVVQVQMKELPKDRLPELVSNLLGLYPLTLTANAHHILVEQNDGTPAQTILTFQRLSDSNRGSISDDEVRRVASQSLTDIWVEIRNELKHFNPATESVLGSLAVFHQAGVRPQTELVLRLAAEMEQTNQKGLVSWLARRRVETAARSLQQYNIAAGQYFLYPDVAVESLADQADAMRILNRFLTNYHEPSIFEPRSGKRPLHDLYAEGLFQLGFVYYLHDQFDHADQAWQGAVRLEPKYTAAWYSLGVLRDNLQRLSEAEQAYRKALEIDPTYAQAWYNLAVLLDNLKSPDSEQAYRKALEIDPQLEQAWNNLGVLLIDQERMAEAEQAFRKALEIDPAYAQAWYNLGVIYQIAGHIADAADALEHGAESEPDNASIQAVLSNLYARLGRTVEAQKALDKAGRLSLSEGIYRRACIEALCGKVDTAFTFLTQALEQKKIEPAWVRHDLNWHEFRADPRFIRLVGEGN